MNNLENKYICKYCGRTFKRQCDLTRHINIKHLKITKASGHGFKTKKQCPNCGRYISIVNFNRHYNSCIKHKKYKYKEVDEIFSKCIKKEDKYICHICNKLCNKYGIKNHIWRKHTDKGKLFNPNNGYKTKGRIAWNKGLTKETDKRIQKIGSTYSKNHKLGLHKIPQRKVIKCATQTKYGWYKGIYCDSSWELAFLIYCLDNGKQVVREERGFEYSYNNQVHTYYPDFLVDNVYYEIKGRDTSPEITKIKLDTVRRNNFEIKILYNKDIIKYIRYVKSKYNVPKVELLYDKDRKNNVFSSLKI